LEFASIDSAGTRLGVRPSRTRVAAVEGLESPALSGESLDGARYRLAPRAVAVTLIEFWSTECVFSERARPTANDLAASTRGAGFAWVAVARERDRAAVEQYLVTHPMTAHVVLPDSSAWQEYNPMGITPLFVVVDRQGVVRYRAAGASAIKPVAAKVKELLRVAPPT
jgi:thiol-disulfide isomerase/thioredoxin